MGQGAAATQLHRFVQSPAFADVVELEYSGWSADDGLLGYLIAAIAVGVEVTSPAILTVRSRFGDAAVKTAIDWAVGAECYFLLEEDNLNTSVVPWIRAWLKAGADLDQSSERFLLDSLAVSTRKKRYPCLESQTLLISNI